MQTALIEISSPSLLNRSPERILNFASFIKHLQKRKAETNCEKSHFFNYVTESFRKAPELLTGVRLKDVGQYREQLQLVYNTLSPIIEDENEQFWGLNWVGSPTIFYSTNGFFNLINDITTGELRKAVVSKDKGELIANQLKLNYSIILEKCFNMPDFFQRKMVHSLPDEKTGLLRYFRLSLDTRFIQAYPLGDLPALDVSALHAAHAKQDELLALLEKSLPADQFRFEGFGITTITDVTPHYALENIRNIIVNRSSFDEKQYYARVIQSLKTLVGEQDIDFGLLPVLQVNGKLIFNNNTCLNSRLIRIAADHGDAEQAYLSLADDYLKRLPSILLTDIMTEEERRDPYLKMLKDNGIQSYALKPVYFNNAVAGLLEVYSTRTGLLDEALLTRLDPAMPLLSQLLQNNIDEFNQSIEKVIKEKFTAVQPAVQWKFNDVAWRYLQANRQQEGHQDMEEVSFENVHPLYGAIDIRNSTVERNEALQKDLRMQFSVLARVLQDLKQKTGFGLLDEKIFVCQQWIERLNEPFEFTLENLLNDFLENDITPFLIQFVEGHQEYGAVAEEYFRAIDEKNGVVNENRRQLESSMNVVIAAVNGQLENLKLEIQQAYPCYFEKFRTDGVEYDIYIGQSIAPDKPFNDIYLKNLRLLQLTSMSAIARYTHSLQRQLSKPVETTQLIFIHSHPIDIRFRRDEKRFDVEGAYNIRYHIVKKRIDKVLIRGTMERLTQPGKIAMVYFNQKEADEYVSYIRFLQGEKILKDHLEYLELEELQGVSGLKAMRVEVNFDLPEYKFQ
jgi:hypothetical protein